MRMTRRTVLAWGTSAVAAGTVPVRLIAETSVGGGSLRTVSDGHLVLPESFVLGDLPAEEVQAVLATAGVKAGEGGYHAPCNLALWQSGDHAVLFDAGSGTGFMPSAGEVIDGLDALGLAPGDITHVVFTHGHPDHLWGAVDDFDEPTFPNARHIMAEPEAAYWSDPATVESIGPARASFAAGAARRIALLGDRLERVAEDAEILPGIRLVPLPGHTPGHAGIRIGTGGTSALVVGDAIGNGHLALARPDWPSPADQDPEQGIATRTALLRDLADSGELMVGFHLPDGGLGTIAVEGDGYRFDPA